MMWFYPMVVFVIMAIKTDSAGEIKPAVTLEQNNDMGEFKLIHKNPEVSVGFRTGKHRSYSMWDSWTACLGGRKTRRRHCIRPDICGDALRVEVASSRKMPPGSDHLCSVCAQEYQIFLGELAPPSTSSPFSGQTVVKNANTLTEGDKLHYAAIKLHDNNLLFKRQKNEICRLWRKYRNTSEASLLGANGAIVLEDALQHCLKHSICGRKIVRQSAYCYLEGSFCQNWIRNRMQRKKDPDHYTVVEMMAKPAIALHPEDSRMSTSLPDCGKLGRYRGTAASRLRYRMRDMVRIIGGRPAPPGKWPWQVAVLNRYKEAFCGGTLIGLRWVVTAAHCVRRRLYVRLGEHDLLLKNRGEVEMRVTEAVTHPLYDPDTVVNDVALLRLPFDARPDLGHGIACLPSPRETLPPHSSCVILGWGKKRPTDIHGTRLLHEAQVSTIQQGVCRRTYWQYAITEDMVCAGRGRRDSCAGDSGGPLLCRGPNLKYYLQGITSFGDGCGKRGKYGIYTRTAGYVTWIKDVMSKKYFD